MKTTPTTPRRPALVAAGLFSLGLALARYGPEIPAIVMFAGAMGVAMAGALLRGRMHRAVLGVAMVALGHGVFTQRILDRAKSDVIAVLGEAPMVLRVEGMIATAPRVGPAQQGRLAAFAWYEKPITRFELDVEAAIAESRAVPASGRLFVRVNEAMESLRAGDRVQVVGMARRIAGPSNPGEQDARLWSAQRGISGQIGVDSAALVATLGESDSLAPRWRGRWLRLLARVRGRAREWLEGQAFGDDARALLNGLLLGERTPDLREVGGAFARVGLSHVLSVSGFHLVAFVGALVLVLRLHGDHPVLEPIIVGLAVVAYMFLMPAQAPIARSGVMLLGLLIAENFGRRYDRLNTLAWVFVLVLAWHPMDLWDIGCQLSFASVAALLVFTRPLRTRLFGEKPNPDTLAPLQIVWERGKDAIAASIAAWGVTTPLVAYHLGLLSPLAPIATLITLPLATAIVALGYAALLVSAVAPWSSGPMRWVLDVGAGTLAEVVLAIDRVPWSAVYLRGNGVSAAWAVAATVVVGWWCVRGTRRRWADVAAVGVMVVWLAARLAMPSLPAATAFRMDSLDVGDGSCHLLRGGDDAVLFDCGSTWYSVGERVIPVALRALRAPGVRTVIISHPDIDHFAGLLDAAGPIGVRRVLVGEWFVRQGAAKPDGPAAFVLEGLKQRGIEVETLVAGDKVEIGGAVAEVLAPARGAKWEKDNESSLVLLVRVATKAGERRALLCGDVERAGIAALRGAHPELRAEIMEAPHHGSARADAIEWVGDVDPEVVVQSTGPSRVDDARWDAVRRRRRWLTTATDGAVWVEVLRGGGVRSGEVR